MLMLRGTGKGDYEINAGFFCNGHCCETIISPT